jgi:hypothetical protein
MVRKIMASTKRFRIRDKSLRAPTLISLGKAESSMIKQASLHIWMMS